MYRYKKISVNGRKVDEHRYVMEQHLGRYLQSWEVVKHVNENVRDNRIDNLYIINKKIAPFAQMAEGKFHKVTKEHLKKSNAICSIKFGHRVMIMDKNNKDLMIVRSIVMAAKCVESHKGLVQYVLRGNRNHTKGFRFRLLE